MKSYMGFQLSLTLSDLELAM